MAERPPQELRYVGGGDFDKIGQQWVDYFVSKCGLRRTDGVLDMGCGVGRVALPLTEYLTGRYEGLDVVPGGIKWCQEHITPHRPNFRFTLADVYNGKYNPDGKVVASEYRFPYDDASFDFAFLTSVFTHLLPDDVVQYSSELARVLKPGGRVVISAYLLNDHSLGVMQRGEVQLGYSFDHDHGVFRASQPEPEEGLAYVEDWFVGTLADSGLSVERIDYGQWAHRESPNRDYQDALVARRVQ